MEAQAIDFKGCEKLIEALDKAVQASTTEQVADQVKTALSDLISSDCIDLPSEVRQPTAESYARRLLYRSPDYGYEIIGMIWGPGQGTPLHDHAGIWCVDGVLDGHVDVTQYDLEEKDGDRFRFVAQETMRAGHGMAGSLIPPFEYHVINNSHADQSSITIHVYGGKMDHCTMFEPVENNWYRRVERELQYAE